MTGSSVVLMSVQVTLRLTVVHVQPQAIPPEAGSWKQFAAPDAGQDGLAITPAVLGKLLEELLPLTTLCTCSNPVESETCTVPEVNAEQRTRISVKPFVE
jgi:hypothetical protein